MGRPRKGFTPADGGREMRTHPKPLKLTHPNCIDKRACDGAALEPTRQQAGICKACMVARATGAPARSDIPPAGFTASFAEKTRPVKDIAASRARGNKTSVEARRKRVNPTFVISESGAARSREYLDAQAKRTKPKRIREMKQPDGMQVLGVKYIGKRPGKTRAA